MEGQGMTEEILVRLNLQSQSLGCVVAQIDFAEKRNCSLFHWQIYKARYLALNFPEVFASPVPQAYQEFQEVLVVAHKDLIESGQVDKFLRDARLSKKRWTLHASSESIQAAVRYTLIARLAPEWNAIACKAVSGSGTQNGDLLLRGSNFLDEAAKLPVDAVRLRVFVADGVAWLGVLPCRCRLPRISLQDLSLNAKNVENLFDHQSGFIAENQIAAPWVHVLPSLKRGRVVHLSRGFPANCPFKNYEDLCKHWEATYGVILPAVDPSAPAVPSVFASVAFLIGARPFLYPMECLLRSCPPFLRHGKPELLIGDLVESVRKCCPEDVVAEVAIAGRPVVQLLPAAKVDLEQSAPNVQSGELIELLRPVRVPAPAAVAAPVANTEEGITENENGNASSPSHNQPATAKPAPCTQPGVHFMDRLSKTVRRPLAPIQLKTSGPGPHRIGGGAAAPAAAARSAPPPTVFRAHKNKLAAPGKAPQPGKARSLVPPKGMFQPLKSKVSSQEKPLLTSCPGPARGPSPFQPRFSHTPQNVSQQRKTQEKPCQIVQLPPTGVFRPIEKIAAKKATDRKGQAQSKPPAKLPGKPPGKPPTAKPPADMDALFRAGNLKKATVGQLLMWLRQNGLEARARDKKDELLERVSSELAKKQKTAGAGAGQASASVSASAYRSALMSRLQQYQKPTKPTSCPSEVL